MFINMPDFASYLKEWRTKANITQIEMASKLNISQSHVSKYESGHKILDLETFIKWARLTNAEANAALLVFGPEIFSQVAQLTTMIPAYALPTIQLFM